MQKRLFFSTAILIALVILTLAGLSNWMVGDQIARRQTEFERVSFRQAGQRVQDIFQSAEGTLDFISHNPTVETILTEPFDRSSPFQTVRSTNVVESALHSVQIDLSSLDSVVLLGKNGFSCVYTQKDILFDTRLLATFPSWDDLITGPLLTGLVAPSEAPQFFHGTATTSKAKSEVERELVEQADQKILLSRQLFSPQGESEGVIIVLLRNDLLATIIPESPYDRALYLCSKSGDLVWSNRPQDPLTEPFLRQLARKRAPWSGRQTTRTGEVLITESILEPTDLMLVSQTPARSYFKQELFLTLVSLGFALGSIVLAFLSSWFFSRNSTRQLEALASHLSRGNQTLPERMDTLPESSWEQQTTLRERLFLHFVVSLVAPLVLCGALLTFFDFQVYQEKIVELARNSEVQFRWALEDKLSSWDRMSRQIVFDDTVQAFLAPRADTSRPQASKDHVILDFLYALAGKTGLLSLHLFDPNGRPLLSSLPFSAVSATDLVPDFFTKMRDSSGQVEFLGESRNFLGRGTSLLFARKISDKGPQFGSLLGYLVFAVEEEAALSQFWDTGIVESGRFSLVTGGPFALETDGIHEIMTSEGPTLIFMDSLSEKPLRLVASVPLNSVVTKVWPLVTLELIVLLVAIVFCAVISVLISRRLGRPLRVLEGLMEDIRREKFDVRMMYSGRDEITVLAHSFNRMVDRLNQLIHENYRSEVEKSKLLLLEKDAQLNVLQQQINPHFLYNTLDSIQWMAFRAGAMDISRMATALGRFFRGVVHTGKGLVTVEEEVELLENYLAIQKIRYEEKLTVNLNVDVRLRQEVTLKLLLQPLVENALTHGIEPLRAGGTIWITVSQNADSLVFEVRDNGVGMTAEQLESIRGNLFENRSSQAHPSIGLANVAQRLRLHYGDSGRLTIHAEPAQGTSITIVQPLQRQ